MTPTEPGAAPAAADDQQRAPLMHRTPSASTLGSLHSDHPQERLDPDDIDDTTFLVAPARSNKYHQNLHHHRSRRRTSSRNAAVARRRLLRVLAFVFSVLSAFCAGSITVFSVYGHLFQSRLHYSQLRVNGVASAMSISMYVPVPVVGYLCDRVGPGPLSLAAAVLGGGGYALGAGLYYRGTTEVGVGGGGGQATFPPMVFAFVAIGVGTACMYFSAITTCAKNFGKGRYRGFMLVAPIAAFGLGGMLLSQVGSRVLYERLPGGGKGDVNVFHFFLFLCIAFVVIGLIGTFALRVVDEEDLIDGAVEELERSGLLEGSEVFYRRGGGGGYGATDNHQQHHRRANGEACYDEEDDIETNRLLDPTKNGEVNGNDNDDDDASSSDDDSSVARLKKAYLLNAETRRFLGDHTMWWFALGFWLIIGPGEAFMNNLGTVIGTLQTPDSITLDGDHTTTAATQVSIMATVSAVARLLAASLSDLLSPAPQNQYFQAGNSNSNNNPGAGSGSGGGGGEPSSSSPTADASHMTDSAATHRSSSRSKLGPLSVSRVTLFIVFGALTSVGTLVLAAGGVQGHGDRFWVVSGCVGAGYGAVFSLTPIIVTIIWGVENFGTNFGIIALTPALGSVMWGLIYSAVYQAQAVVGGGGGGGGDGREEARDSLGGSGDGGDVFCYGKSCYASTFWAMTASVWLGVLLVVWAWKGKGGWSRRGIVI